MILLSVEKLFKLLGIIRYNFFIFFRQTSILINIVIRLFLVCSVQIVFKIVQNIVIIKFISIISFFESFQVTRH